MGGSEADTSMTNITLAWMMSQFAPRIAFSSTYLAREVRVKQALKDTQHCAASGRGYALGTIYKSAQFPTNRRGTAARTPRRYCLADHGTVERQRERLTDTNEYVLASVRACMFCGGLGYEDEGRCKPEAHDDWEVEKEHHLADGRFFVAVDPLSQRLGWRYKGMDMSFWGE